MAVGIAAVCVRLGIWQLHRLGERRAYNAAARAGLSLPPLGNDELLDGSTTPTEVSSYRRAEVTGSYDVTHEIVLYGRALDGAPGNHLLTPLLLDDGTAVLVDRGWVPQEVDTLPVSGHAAAPDVRVRITGVLIPGQPAADTPASPALPSLVRSIDPDALATGLPYRLLPTYLLLDTQDPPQTEDLPRPGALPDLTEGPHLSYAIQWFVFATIALVGYGVLSVRDRREGRASAGGAGIGTHEGER